MLTLRYVIFTVSSFFMISCGGSGSNNKDITAPLFIMSDTISISENKVYVTMVYASDISSIQYIISGGDDRIKFSLNSTTGELLFNSPQDFENPLDMNKDNIYEVKITAIDSSRNKREQVLQVIVVDKKETTAKKNIIISDIPQIETLGIADHIDINLSLGEESKDVYLLFSNYSKVEDGIIKIKSSVEDLQVFQEKYKSIVTKTHLNIGHTSKYSEIFRKNIKQYINQKIKKERDNNRVFRKSQKKDILGKREKFYLDENKNNFTYATTRSIVSGVATEFGDKTLNIWVSDDCFGFGCQKKKCVTQDMVDALADAFLKEGEDNDIYDWVTNIFGEEWGEHTENNMIPQNNEITILLTDIDNDNNDLGGVLGFFYTKDNIKKSILPESNERIMFYADAVLFSNVENEWDIDNFWPKEIISTLAHEFQHMIHFYHKNILQGVNTDTWINEMLSESTEDLIATKIKHTGPRGVVHTDGSAGDYNNIKGRYPLFNQNNRLSLTTWQEIFFNYSNVNAFGAYLIRNYGGAKLLHDILHDRHQNEDAIVTAINKTPKGTEKTFNDLLKEWGVAVILSDNKNLSEDLPRYNTGDFIENSYNNSIYQMGSINFFNYIPKPNFFRSLGRVSRQGNYYYKVGSNLSGDIELNLTLNGQTETTLIVK